ncbi:MAG: histidine phosphatase family protein [Planctomycetes bacterium]|nr:histidine phosphatase family protein [Planctomycetota bacterium]
MRAFHRALALGLAGVALVASSLALASSQSAGGAPPEASPPAALARPTTLCFVRHAEKEASSEPKDPTLSAAGRKRALALAALCSHGPVTHLFASEYRRTRETLLPLAEQLGLEVRGVPAGKPGELVRALEALPEGSVALVAGHSNTLPDLIARLGGKVEGTTVTNGVATLPDDAFDRLFVLTLPPASARATVAPSLIELRYGD